MSKRAYVEIASDSDDESRHSAQSSSKRLRRGTNGEGPHAQSGRNKGKGKARAVNATVEIDEEQDDENDSEDDIVIPEIEPHVEQDLDQEEFERQNGELVQTQLENKRKDQIPGCIAEHGIIEYIEMHQFMCHKYLKFNFGPQINFIIGHNGSGKSAVLSAITVALGGKSTSTGRGTGLKSFIREGQNAAEVTIHLKNQGEEAYRPNDYGQSIVITRHFTKNGASTWKFKNKDGVVISTKREELTAICQHMNIQVDNPMNILTQDSARKFLSSSTPNDKYHLFLKATLLQQLSDEYELISDNVSEINRLLIVKKNAIPDLKARRDEALARFSEAAKAQEQKEKVAALKKELAWSYVSSKAAELEEQETEVATISTQLSKLEDSLSTAKAQFDLADEKVSSLQTEKDKLQDIEGTSRKKIELQDDMRRNKVELQRLNGEIAQVNQAIGETNERLVSLERDIRQKEEEALKVLTPEMRAERQRNIQEARQNVTTLENRMKELLMGSNTKKAEAHDIKGQMEELQKKLTTLQTEIASCNETISTIQGKEEGSLGMYGTNIRFALEKIRAARWFGEVPLGPLGLYVTAKDPRRWGELLRNQMGRLLVGYAITDPKDRPQLKRILQECGNTRVPAILVHKNELFDYSAGEPPEEHLTVLRALNITNEHVKRIFVNQFHAESRLLTAKREQAESILKSLNSRNGSAWSLDRMFFQIYPEGGSLSTPIYYRLRGAMNLLLTGGDSATEIREWKNRKTEAEERHRTLLRRMDELNAQQASLSKDIGLMDRHEHTLQSHFRDAKRHLAALEFQIEAGDDVSVGLASSRELKESAIKDKESYTEQFKELAMKKAAIDRQQQVIQDQLDQIRKHMSDNQDKRNEAARRLEVAFESRLSAENRVKHYTTKHAEKEEQLNAAKEKARLLQEEFTIWRGKASQYSDEVPNPRKTEDVKRQLDSLEKALRDRESRAMSIEETTLALRKAEETVKTVMTELKQLVILSRALHESLIVRRSRWDDFRMYMALRCKLIFQLHISMRGYYGKALFHHKSKELVINVQKEDQLTQRSSQSSKDQIKGLSGGEKSFSTISLIQALWDCVECPLRCLDEFDVFMDAVNRRTSMRLLTETANASNKKQYIFITPQDMNNVVLGPSVRVLRMSDPERGNGTLSFASSST